MKKFLLIAVAIMVVGVAGVAGAASSGLLNGRHIKKNSIPISRLTKKTQKLIRQHNKVGVNGVQGPAGPKGDKGASGPQGIPAETKIASGGGDFTTTNSTVTFTPDGVHFGPYANGGASHGSVEYTGLNGHPLRDVKSLVYLARYTADNDTGGVGVPYLRVFLNGDNDDIIFSPNTQPDADVAQGPFHTWVGTMGVWRYDDDGGSGGQYGLSGAPFSTVVGDHGSEIISGIYVSTGDSAGTNLDALLRSLEVNGSTFAFGL